MTLAPNTASLKVSHSACTCPQTAVLAPVSHLSRPCPHTAPLPPALPSRQAEAVFAELKKSAPDACAQQLVRSLRQSPALETRALCAVLLRKVLTKDDASIWPHMAAPVKEVTKQEMLNCIKEEQMRAITKKVGAADLERMCVCGLVGVEAEVEGWGVGWVGGVGLRGPGGVCLGGGSTP